MTDGLATCKCDAAKYLKTDLSACGTCGSNANCDGTTVITCKTVGWVAKAD